MVDTTIDETNEALMKLGTEISKALNTYIKSGSCNFAAAIGVLEDSKMNVSRLARKLQPNQRVTFLDESPDYIG